MNYNDSVFACCHNHSCFSDAEYSPEKIVELAHGLGHGGIILTDHDTIRGSYFANKAARKLGMKNILGCEFTTYYGKLGIHLLGFDFNPDNAKMKELLAKGSGVQTSRTEVLAQMGIERGTLRDGWSWQDVLDDHPYNDYICVDQVFVTLVKKGIYKQEEYNEFHSKNFSYRLGLEDAVFEKTGKSYRQIDTESVVKTILEAGGVPVVAHPVGLRERAGEFINMGVLGFEVRHPDLWDKYAAPGHVEFFDELCTERGLYKMGGGDHSGILGGNLDRGEEFHIPDFYTGINEEEFMKLYERRLG